jgi:pimeloyl-ACP methyl ester carboxylesterase
LIELDISGGDHLHSVWRDFQGDWGRDVLGEHYRNARHPRTITELRGIGRRVDVQISDLTFDCDVAGAASAPLVLLLHGFPQTSYTYRHELPALARAGFLAVAPNQRGYSAGARPTGVESYGIELLIADALAIADYFGGERFHLVGHDWGGQLAWLIAARHPERLHSLSVLSRPHPAAFRGALKSDPAQAQRSRHHSLFQDPESARRLLADDAARLRKLLANQGVGAVDIAAYLERLKDEAALDAAINWYRPESNRASAKDVPNVSVPTLYVWGDQDATVGRAAAEATAAHVTGPYQFEVVAGAGHFLTDQAGAHVSELIVAHVLRHGA